MSIEATTTTFNRLRELPELLQAVPARRRPSVQNCALVALLLADRMRDRKGYVDETVEQVIEVLPLSKATVTNCLYALDLIGWWRREAKGNHRGGTRRTPNLLAEHREADPTEPHGGADLTMPDGEHREVGDAASWGSAPSIVRYGHEHREADPTPPHHPHPVTPPSSPEDEQELVALVGAHLDAHVAFDPVGQIIDPVAVRLAQFPRALAVAREARDEFGEDPRAALEALWATRPDDSAGEFDPALWPTEEVV